MYKGKAKPEAFAALISKTKHPLVYNGDINSVADADHCNTISGNRIEAFMLGRGLLMNPFLAAELKGRQYTKEEKRATIKEFHTELFELSKQKLEPSHLLGRMIAHWEYLSFMFPNQHKVFKAIKKCKRIDKYEQVVEQAFRLDTRD